MITELTHEQSARLPLFRAEYYRYGTSTEPADRLRAEAAFARAYRTIGRKPVPTIWVDSPLTASIVMHLMPSLGENLKESLWRSLGPSLQDSIELGLPRRLVDSLWNSLWRSLWRSLGESLGSVLQDSLERSLQASLGESLYASLGDSLGSVLQDSLGSSLRASLGGSLGGSLGSVLQDSLESSLYASLYASLGDSLRGSLDPSLKESLYASLGDSLGSVLQDSIERSLGDSLGDSLWDSQIRPQNTYWWGQQDLYWIEFYRFCAEIGAQYEPGVADRLDIMHEIGLSCMWWYPRDGLIIACERPESICVDSRERLHNESGPAVRFRDGWTVYAVHGVRVPAAIIEHPETITVAAIEAEPNTEVQRVMIERYGWDRYAAECGAEVIDHDERWGTLYGRDDAALFVRVINGSPELDGSFRQYVLPVFPQCEPIPDPDDPAAVLGEPQSLTALNAVASTYGMRGEEYAALSVRT